MLTEINSTYYKWSKEANGTVKCSLHIKEIPNSVTPSTQTITRDSTEIKKKNRYIFILIRQICVFVYIIVSCVNIKAVIFGGLQVNNNSLKGSHGCYTARGTRSMN